MRSDIVSQVAKTLSRHDLPGEAIELEITETAAMTDLEYSMRVLQEIREMGVKLAIDDFGTGYSSLGRLKEFPIHTLKIDLSFVRQLPDDESAVAITRSIISSARAGAANSTARTATSANSLWVPRRINAPAPRA